jgi:ABC-type dipeptide/oligopeptide/nickel transport system permease component
MHTIFLILTAISLACTFGFYGGIFMAETDRNKKAHKMHIIYTLISLVCTFVFGIISTRVG